MSDLPDWTRSVAVEVNAEAPTEYWLAKNGTLIIKEEYGVPNDRTTLYTVPAAKELFVLYAGLAIVLPAGSFASLSYCNPDGQSIFQLYHEEPHPYPHAESKMFLKMDAADFLEIYTESCAAYGYFYGYLLDV